MALLAEAAPLDAGTRTLVPQPALERTRVLLYSAVFVSLVLNEHTAAYCTPALMRVSSLGRLLPSPPAADLGSDGRLPPQFICPIRRALSFCHPGLAHTPPFSHARRDSPPRLTAHCRD